MKRTRYFSLIIALMSVLGLAAQEQQSQYALYNYRNDGDFNAWLNIDVDSITYSNIGLDSVEYDNIVTQEVWTPDSCYRIPIEAIDSIGFRAPAPEFKEGIFYLRDYHAAFTNSIDSLTIYFDDSILQDSLPTIGQPILCATKMTPYEDGFAGKVVEIKTTSEGIAVICEEAGIADLFKQLVLVGKVLSEQADEEPTDSRMKASSSDPWINLEESGVKRKELKPLSFDLFDGLIEVISPRPRLMCSYYIYVSEVYYEMYVNVDLQHRDLTYKLTFSTEQLKDLEDYGSFFKALATDNIDEWLNEKMTKSIKKYIKEQKYEDQLAEASIAEKIWKTKKWDIPIIEDGVLNLTLTLAPLFKTKGSISAITEFKTDAMQNMRIKVSGLTPLAKSTSKFDEAKISFHQDPIKSTTLDIQAQGSVTLGFTGLLNVNVVHRKVLYAGIGGEFGVDLTGILNATIIDTEQPDMNMYDRLKDTRLKISEYGKWYLEAGISPLDIFHLRGPKWDIFSPYEQIYYLMPHFTEPQMPKFGERTWLGKDPLSFYTYASKDVFIPCRIGIRITDEEGNVKKEYINDNEKYVWEKDWLNRYLKVNVSDLPQGASYRCYPVMSFLNGTVFNAGPHHDFYVPLPMVASPSELTLAVGGTGEVKFFGGWDTFATVIEEGDDVASIVRDGEPRRIKIHGIKEGHASLKIEDRRTGQIVHVPIIVSDAMTLVTGITLSETTLNMNPCDTKALTATVMPEDAENKTVKWTSSNGAVAMVSTGGLVTAIGEGTCTITCSATDGSGVKADCQVTVTKLAVTQTEETLIVVRETGLFYEPTYAHVDFTAAKTYLGVNEVTTDMLFIINPDNSEVCAYKGTFRNDGWFNGDGFETEWGTKSMICVKFFNAIPDGQFEILDMNGADEVGKTYTTRWALKANGKTYTYTINVTFVEAHEWVDLGLPSGTLWATCNVGANSPEEYGDYFAWGETTPKDYYDENTYFDSGYNKYNDNDNGGLTELLPEDDAATKNWGSPWHMPTPEQIRELLDNCTREWTTQGGVNGILVTGPSGGQIFLPAAGMRWFDELRYAGSIGYGYYWSSSCSYGCDAWYLGFRSVHNWSCYRGGYRWGGHSVRPVRVQGE